MFNVFLLEKINDINFTDMKCFNILQQNRFKNLNIFIRLNFKYFCFLSQFVPEVNDSTSFYLSGIAINQTTLS